MTKHITSLFLSIFFTFVVSAQTVDTSYVDGAVYLKLHDTTTANLDLSASSFPALASLFSSYSVTQVKRPFLGINLGLSQTYRIEFAQSSSISAFLLALSQIAYVDYAEAIPLFYTSAVPNDFHTNQWYLTKINAVQAWDLSTGNAAVKIAIVDNAVSTLHEDLSASIAINSGEIPNNGIDDDLNGYIDDYKGYDVANGDNDPNPPASAGSNSPWVHGTHCSGIASASTNNNVGMAGMGYNCSIIPVKCTPNSSAGNTLNAAYEGVAYAINAGANIISMSFGSSGTSITGQNIVNAAYLQGITLVGAAGNDNSSASFYPAAYSQVISVGATDYSDQRANFSNYGPTIDVMAPGAAIYSTLSGGSNNQYGSLSGTSMACPLVAGLCGLIKSQNMSRTPDQIKTLLVNGCENIDLINPNYIGQMGAGRINAYNSLGGNVTNVQELNSAIKILSQNPFHESITLQVIKNQSYRIANIQGKIIEEFVANEEEKVIGEQYKSGVYFVFSTEQTNQKALKVIKQ